MINNLPRNVFSFLYIMWGGVGHKYETFLSPKRMEKSKEKLIKLKADCEAVIWILEHKNADYSETVAKAYTTTDVVYFAASTAVIYAHEHVFELCGVPFDNKLLPDDMNKEVLLKFYVDQPKSISLIRYFYTHFLRATGVESNFDFLHDMIFSRFESCAMDVLNDIKLVSHYDAMDYAIALKDYNNPLRAQSFFKDLEITLSRVYSDK